MSMFLSYRVALKFPVGASLLFVLPLLLAVLFSGGVQAQMVRNHDDEGGVRNFHALNTARAISRSFDSDVEARAEFSRILASVGLTWISDRIALRASAETDNAMAGMSKKGERFIFYNATFMQKVKAKTAEHWTLVSILAHELGHHLAFHTELEGRYHEFELEADYFSGFVLRRLGASLDQSHLAMKAISPMEPSLTHPGLMQRLEAITIGWTDGGSSGPPRGLKKIQDSVTGPETALTTSPTPIPSAKSFSASAPRMALVVGNGDYIHFPTIPNAVLDAVRVTTELEQRGFRVIKAINMGKETLIKTVTEFESALSIVGGTGLVYYAGQAVYVDGEDIMLPVDAKEENNTIVGGLNLTQLMRELQSRTTTPMKNNGSAIIYSASKGEQAADGLAGGNSPFTTAFIRALGSGEDELSDTFRRIQTEMETVGPIVAPGHKQTPFFESSLRSQYFLGRPDKDPQGTISRILIFDSCRDNPFKQPVAMSR